MAIGQRTSVNGKTEFRVPTLSPLNFIFCEVMKVQRQTLTPSTQKLFNISGQNLMCIRWRHSLTRPQNLESLIIIFSGE